MGNISILLADDSITIQKVVGIIFGSDEYTLHVVDNGKDALQKGKELKPDLFLIDAIMPGMDGYQVCEAIRNEPAISTRPVLLLTGSFEPFDEEKARDCGADDHILKPFESQLIVDKVQELYKLGQKRLADSPAPPAASAQIPVEEEPSPFDQLPSAFTEDSTPATEEDDNVTFPFETNLVETVGVELEEQTTPDTKPTTEQEPEPVRPTDDPWGAFIQQPVTEDQQAESVMENANFDLSAQLSEMSAMQPSEEPKTDSFSPSWLPVEEQTFEFSEEVAAIPDGILKVEPSTCTEAATPPLSMESTEEPTITDRQVVANLDDDQIREIILSASRETVERIVWDIVPDLAENMVKEAIRKITDGK